MAQTSSLWSRGLLSVFLIIVGILQISSKSCDKGIPVPWPKGEDKIFCYLTTEITNLEFNKSLQDSTSTYYLKLSSEISDALTQTFRTQAAGNHYLGTGDTSFSKGHQIKVDTTLFFPSNVSDINLCAVQNILRYYMHETNITFNATYVSNSSFLIDTTKSPVTHTTTVPSTTKSSPTTFTTETTSSSTTHFTFPSSSPPVTTTVRFTSPTSSEGPGTNGTTSAAAIDHTTPVHNHTTDLTTNASTVPPTTNPDSAVTKTSVVSSTIIPGLPASTKSLVPTTRRPDTSDHSTDHSSAASANSASKPTINHQEAAKSTGTTPYPLVPYWLDWVPGWGIALLVLASLILLLLIILIVLLLLRWCCMKEPEADPYSHSPYTSHSPAKTPVIGMTDHAPWTPEKPKGNRTGMYVVNP